MSFGTAAAIALGLVLLVLALRSRDGRGATLDGATATVEELMAAGRKIDAIKRYREQHAVGLKEAKEAVEALARGSSVPGT